MRELRPLELLGYRPRSPVSAEDFADRSTRESWVQDKNPRLEVELFVREPFDFDTVYEQTEEVLLETTSARVVPREILIEMKHQAGRPRDLEDAEALEALGESQEYEILCPNVSLSIPTDISLEL